MSIPCQDLCDYKYVYYYGHRIANRKSQYYKLMKNVIFHQRNFHLIYLHIIKYRINVLPKIRHTVVKQ